MQSKKISILVVNNEKQLRTSVVKYLERANLVVRKATDGTSAWKSICNKRPSIILLDWKLPDINGIKLLKKIRRKKGLRRVAVIMLTSYAGEQGRIDGLEAGADDYIVKPFSLREMVARINAVLRRLGESLEQEESLVRGEITVDVDKHKVFFNGNRAHLSPTEFRLLHFFMSHSGRTYSRDELLNQVWGELVVVEERTVDQHIRRLRKILKKHNCKDPIATVRGFGYKFEDVR